MQDTTCLETESAALSLSLRDVQAQLRYYQKVALQQKSREFSARRQHVRQAVLVLLLHDSDRSWLQAFMKQRGMISEDSALSAFDEEVCNQFLSLSEEEINGMREPTDKQGKAMLREAKAFIAEYELHAWVARQNENHGVAPTVSDTLRHRDELSAVHCQQMEQPSLWSVAKSARYKWSARFRNRWHLGLRKPHAREAVPLDIARRKAAQRRPEVESPSQFA